jgi:hypothetical protein
MHRLPENAHHERFELAKIASARDKSIRSSSKDIYHIESFCLHVFRIVKVLMLTKQRQTPKIKVKESAAPGTKSSKKPDAPSQD